MPGEFACIVTEPSSRRALRVCSTSCWRLSNTRYLGDVRLAEFLLSSRLNRHIVACGVVSLNLLTREISLCQTLKYIQISSLTTWSSSSLDGCSKSFFRILDTKDWHYLLGVLDLLFGDRWGLEGILVGNVPAGRSDWGCGSTDGFVSGDRGSIHFLLSEDCELLLLGFSRVERILLLSHNWRNRVLLSIRLFFVLLLQNWSMWILIWCQRSLRTYQCTSINFLCLLNLMILSSDHLQNLVILLNLIFRLNRRL